MLRFLTHKLRTHTIDDVQPFQPKIDDDRDSGTESDDENTELEELHQSMDKGINLGSNYKFDSESNSGADSELSTGLMDHCHHNGNRYEDTELYNKCESPTLDSALPSDTDHNFDHHSSEEELEVINNSCNARDGQYPEKRKWSQANRLSFGDSSGSSDDEVRDLMCSAPVEFRSSPPADAHKPSHSQSPPAKLFHFSQSNFTPFEVCSVSPRKRQRQNHSSNATPVQRPCLDFEKMQQLRTRAVTAWRTSREVSLIC